MTDQEKAQFLTRWLQLAEWIGLDEFEARVDGDGTPHIMVNVNDMFAWACADAEEVTAENIERLAKAIEDAASVRECGQFYGGILFAARERGMRPQDAIYGSVPAELHALLNECGPPRENGLGNPPRTTTGG